VIATSHLPEDQPLADLASRVGVGCFRGSPDDVLGRLAAAAAGTKADLLVELLGDNPLVHSALIDDVVDLHVRAGHDYSASVTVEYPHAGPEVAKFPVGIRVQVFSPEVLARAAREAQDPYQRENATTYVYGHPELFTLGYIEAIGKWRRLHRPGLTFAVNYRRNFDLVSRLFERCYPADANFSLIDVIEAFDGDPQLAGLMGNEEPRAQ
jgi:spore coat polysaccharide biosynthesis protein SpsF